MNQQWPRVAQIDHVLGPASPSSAFAGGRTAPTLDTTPEIGDLWRILLRRWRGIALVAALLVVPAALYALLTPSLYTATSQILVDPRDRQVVSNDLNSTGISPDGGVTQVESQVKVIESNSVLLRAIKAAGLETDPDYGAAQGGILGRLGAAWFGQTPGEDAETARALRNLRRKLAVKRAEKVLVIDVVVTATSPEKSARIANAIAQAYLDENAEARADAARRASSELRARLEALREDVGKAESRLEAFKAEHGFVASSGQILGDQQLSDNNSRIVAARNRTAEAKARLSGVRDARGRAFDAGATPEAIGSGAIERLRAQYAELASREADLRSQLGARHPTLLAIQTQKAEVKRLIDAELSRIVQSAEIDYQRALANERSLTQNLDGLRTESLERNKAAVQLRELERAADATRSVYNAFLLRSREISEQAGVDPTNARVITWARRPDERSWPIPFLIIGAAALAGIGIGMGTGLVREYLNPALMSRGQMERLLNAPVLATLTSPDPRANGRAAAGFVLDRLMNRDHAGRGPRRALSILVTTAGPDDAVRSAMIELLADVAQSRGDRVLVVDANLDSPETNREGLLEVLRGEQTINSVAAVDGAPGARRMGIGDRGRPLRDALNRDNVRRFMASVGERFDLVLLDGGILTENLRIAPLACASDEVVVVGHDGITLQRELIELADVASSLRCPIGGSLLVESGPRAR